MRRIALSIAALLAASVASAQPVGFNVRITALEGRVSAIESGGGVFGTVALNDRLVVSPVVKGAGQFDGTFTSADLTAARTWTLPNLSGTIALSGDAPFYFGLVSTHDRIVISPVVKGAGQFDGTFTSADLTAARSWTMPNGTGTVALTTDIPAAPTLAAVTAAGASTLTAITLGGASPVVFDGATAGTYATTLTITDPTAARTVTLPDASGTIAFAGATVTSTLYTDANGTFGQRFPQKTLTDAGGAQGILDIGITADNAAGISVEFTITVIDTGAHQTQARHGTIQLTATNQNGAMACALSAANELTDGSVLAGTGTLSNAITCTTGTAKVTLNLNPDSSLTTPVDKVSFRVDVDQSAANVITLTGL